MFEEFLSSWTVHLSLLAEIVMVLLVTAAVSYGCHRLCITFQDSKKVHYLLRSSAASLLKPGQWFIWGYAGLAILQMLIGSIAYFHEKFDLDKIQQLYFAIGIFWLVLIWKENIIEHFLKRAEKKNSEKDDKALIQALNRLGTTFIILVGVFVILDIFNVPLGAFVTSGIAGGLAISLAAKDMLSNFFGGLMIYIHRHFVVGDWIMSPNKNFEGVVEEIGWYMTRIRTFERRPLFIPNAVVTDAIVENPGRMYNRRIKKEIGIRYDDIQVVKPIIEEIEKMLREHPAIDLNQTLMVDLIDFGPYSLVISVYCFTKTTNWQQWRQEQQDVLLKIADIVAGHGAEIAFPTNTVHLRNEGSDKSITDHNSAFQEARLEEN